MTPNSGEGFQTSDPQQAHSRAQSDSRPLLSPLSTTLRSPPRAELTPSEHEYFTPRETTRSTHESEHFHDDDTHQQPTDKISSLGPEEGGGNHSRRRSGSTVSASALAAAVSALPPLHPTPVSTTGGGATTTTEDGAIKSETQVLPPPSHLAPLPPSSSLPSSSTSASATSMIENVSSANTTASNVEQTSPAGANELGPGGLASTAASSQPPSSETIDPIASYSAWRKKKDTETSQGTQAVMESFLKQHSAYDVLPVSYRQIVLDTTLLVKKALSVLMQYNIVSAPLWDSSRRKFAGMLTATDFINLIQFYYSHSSYTAAIREMDQFQISQLRDVEKVIGVPPPELFSLHPLQSLYDACQLLVESRAHRLPLVDVDSETGEEMIVSVLTQYRILKFIAMNYQDEKTLRQPLSELKIGIYTDLATADLSTPVMAVIDMFVKRRISSVPIVDENGVVLNVFETVDVMTLVKAGVYRDLDLCVAEALLRRPEDFAGVHTCTLNDSLSSIFGTIRQSQVHRLIVVDSENKLKGIVSLSDIMRYLIGGGNNGRNFVPDVDEESADITSRGTPISNVTDDE
ncbi:AMP-activated serine/threonine-protein kinase regulatory subunit [Gryganskiella cystojenkinii]|nr:AMP-activated serine/threonine-protein kinase regulatory subunit [Gryganskiella cystojenkinii]